MKISIVGTGTIATAFCYRLLIKGQKVVQILSRTPEKPPTFATQLKLPVVAFERLDPSVDAVILAVRDDALPTVAEHLPKHKHPVYIHTAGSVDLNALTPFGHDIGVIYPLNTFTLGQKIRWDETPILTESLSERAAQRVDELARSLSPCVSYAATKDRQNIHLGAVFASNFVNALIGVAANISGQPHSIYMPLIEQTIAKLKSISPAEAQTGPAKRSEQTVLQKHETMLIERGQPQILQIYKLLTALIQSND